MTFHLGMHEVLAPLYYVIDFDSIPSTESVGDPKVQEICSRDHIAADAYALFGLVMNELGPWYEWREPSAGIAVKGPVRQWTAPIVETCNKIQGNLLRGTDPMLWKYLQATGIEPQLYGM
jgi:TBC1 domain family member 5